MDLTNFILLAVERDMITNKYGLDLFYTVFKEASKNQPASKQEGSAYESTNSSSVLINHSFFRAITMLAKSLFAHEEEPFESMFSQLLVYSTPHPRQAHGRRQKPQTRRRNHGNPQRGGHQSLLDVLQTT